MGSPWPDFLPPPLFLDYETHTDSGYNVRRIGQTAYLADEKFFVQVVSVIDPVAKTRDLIWDYDIPDYMAELRTHDRTLVAHNTFFDGKIAALKYGKRFANYACTLSMARVLLRHRSQGYSLQAVYQFLFGRELPKSAVKTVEGLREIPQEMREDFGRYCMNDSAAMAHVFFALAKQFPDNQWWHLYWSLVNHIHPRLVVGLEACREFKRDYEEQSEILYGQFGLVEADFASAKKFANVLVEHGQMYDSVNDIGDPDDPAIPTTKGAKGIRHAFSKKDEGFIKRVLESDDPNLRELGRLRKRAASSSEYAQATNLEQVHACTGGPLSVALNYGGCATNRISGNGDTSGINKLAIKRGSLMRHALKAPKAKKIMSLDMSAFELGICRYLAQDKNSIEQLSKKDGDIYVDFARLVYKDPTITKKSAPEKREVGKTSELQCQYNSGAATLRSQLLEKGAYVSMKEATDIVHKFRHVQHKQLFDYWQLFGRYIVRMSRKAAPIEVENAPFLHIEPDGIRLPTGLKLWFPDLRKRGGDWTYQKTVGTSFVRDKLYGGKAMQYCCQALANCIIQEKKRAIAREVGLVAVHEVYDDMTFLVPDGFTQDEIDAVTSIAVRPVSFWPELPLSCEYGLPADSWGECDKSIPVWGPHFDE